MAATIITVDTGNYMTALRAINSFLDNGDIVEGIKCPNKAEFYPFIRGKASIERIIYDDNDNVQDAHIGIIEDYDYVGIGVSCGDKLVITNKTLCILAGDNNCFMRACFLKRRYQPDERMDKIKTNLVCILEAQLYEPDTDGDTWDSKKEFLSEWCADCVHKMKSAFDLLTTDPVKRKKLTLGVDVSMENGIITPVIIDFNLTAIRKKDRENAVTLTCNTFHYGKVTAKGIVDMAKNIYNDYHHEEATA